MRRRGFEVESDEVLGPAVWRTWSAMAWRGLVAIFGNRALRRWVVRCPGWWLRLAVAASLAGLAIATGVLDYRCQVWRRGD